MLEKFLKYNQEKSLLKKTDKILLTVSGGKDSVFMVELFKQLELDFGIAHCNFKLRGKESDIDEEFVKDLASKNNIQFYKTTFETGDYAEKEGISIQMAARDLRYKWFEKIREENNYNFIATAHHKNDVAETMLINLTKGTGLSGLHGIREKTNYIIRPILCFTRNDIETYILDNKISYREDLSNSDTKYVRNKIRHNVITELEKINTSFIETANKEADQFYDMEQILNQKIEEEKEKCFVQEDESIKIDIEKLKSLTPLHSYLYYFIRSYGYNKTSVNDIVDGLNEQSGKVYFSSTHQILKDRKYLIISEFKKEQKKQYSINSNTDFINLPIGINALERGVDSKFKLQKSSQFAFLDAEKIMYPLVLRRWKEGDLFQPLGMKGNKKVSDFFIDEKLSVIEKQNAWILTSQDKIVWIVGLRIDNRYKITNKTKNSLVLNYHNG